MSILIDEKTLVIVQGFTGDKATFHAREMIAYGTQVVGGVTPGKGGQRHLDRPVFNTVKDAVRATGAEASLAFVPPPYAADALMEAADAGLRLVCIITDGIPSQDMMRVKRYLRRYPKERRTTIVGPNCAGIISAGKAMLGIMPSNIYLRGNVGVVSRSGTLGYEAGAQMKALGIGVTTSVGIGGDPINGSSFLDHLMLFEEDPETKAVIMIGEIGGPQEAEAANGSRKHEQTRGRLCRRLDRTQGQTHGPRGRHHFGGRRQRGREVGDHEVLRPAWWRRARRSSARRSRWRSPRGRESVRDPAVSARETSDNSRAPRCSSICSPAWCSGTRRRSPRSCARSAALRACRSRFTQPRCSAQGIWFQLLAIAEQNRDMRNRREVERERGYEQLSGTFASVFAAAAAEGITSTEIRAALANLRVRPVITAHPTEAKRVTVMERHRRHLSEAPRARIAALDRSGARRVDPGPR